MSEHLGDERLDVTKYVLDVGVYTRRIKARILYNHLLVSETPQSHVRSLIESKKLAAIIDHPNYNPRVIEAMTDALRVGDIESGDYPDAFLGALKNPSQIWDTAFRNHIDHRCRHLLIAMFFLSEYGVPFADLRASYDALHTSMSSTYGLPHGPKDFEEALRILEGSFVKIDNVFGHRVSFVNPSLKDYLSSYLLDADLLVRLVPTAVTIDWLSSLWAFVHPLGLSEVEQRKIANACVGSVEMIETRPHWRPKPGDARSLEYNDAENSKRLSMLMDWWQLTDDIRFADSVMKIARNPQQGFGSWSDGETLIDFFHRLRDRGYGRPFVYEEDFLALVEKAITDTIRWSASDALSTLVDAVDAAKGDLPGSITTALAKAVLEEFEENSTRVSEEESESSLSDRIDALKKFAPRYGIPESVLYSAISTIEDRIGEIEERSSPASSPSFTPSKKREAEKFDNEALTNLFTPLLDR